MPPLNKSDSVNRWMPSYNEDVKIHIASCILDCVNSLHSKNIVHGDIKPENIILFNTSRCYTILHHITLYYMYWIMLCCTRLSGCTLVLISLSLIHIVLRSTIFHSVELYYAICYYALLSHIVFLRVYVSPKSLVR